MVSFTPQLTRNIRGVQYYEYNTMQSVESDAAGDIVLKNSQNWNMSNTATMLFGKASIS